MIVDADCHISPFREGVHISADELLRRMDRSGVDKAIVWLTPPYKREIDESNAYVCQAVRAHADRLLGFGWADPRLGVQKAREMARKCMHQYGFHGVKINGAQNDFFIDDPEVSMPLVEEIAKAGKLLAFHCGVDAFERTHPHADRQNRPAVSRDTDSLRAHGRRGFSRHEQGDDRGGAGVSQPAPDRQHGPAYLRAERRSKRSGPTGSRSAATRRFP